VKKEVLSGNDWLSTYGDKPGEATYQVEAPEAGSYTLWARVNPVASEPKWKVDGAEWQAVTLGTVQQQQNIASDGKIDHRFIGWVKIGALQLAKGKHTVAFRFEGPVANSGGLDCFVLTTEKFVPQGTMKPFGRRAAVAAGGPGDWFRCFAEDDTFDARSVIECRGSCRRLRGSLVCSGRGEGFKFRESERAGEAVGRRRERQSGHYSASNSRGAQYLRSSASTWCASIRSSTRLSSNGKIDPKKLDEYDWWFAELKKARYLHGLVGLLSFRAPARRGLSALRRSRGTEMCATLMESSLGAETLGDRIEDARRVA
jgi:hypothetical protein